MNICLVIQYSKQNKNWQKESTEYQNICFCIFGFFFVQCVFTVLLDIAASFLIVTPLKKWSCTLFCFSEIWPIFFPSEACCHKWQTSIVKLSGYCIDFVFVTTCFFKKVFGSLCKSVHIIDNTVNNLLGLNIDTFFVDHRFAKKMTVFAQW